MKLRDLIKKGFAKDLSLNIIALLIMNIVIQFAVYPYINTIIGEDAFGTVLYLLSIISVVAVSLGGALNNVRLATKPKYRSSNGDYNSLLLIFCGIACAVALFVLWMIGESDPVNYLFYCMLMVFSVIRYYSDVAFRINLNFKLYFWLYIIISVGYCVGVGIFHISGIWFLALLPGEILALLFTAGKGDIYKKPFACSENKGRVWKDVWIVALSYLISNFFLNIDRIILRNVLGGDAVTTFYTASVLGKTLSLLIGPLTGVLISYLSNYKGEIGRKTFVRAVGVTIILAAVGFVACVLISPWLIRWLYPNVYEQAYGLIGVGTLGQIIFFASSLLLTIILRFCQTKHQFTIQLVYGIIYLVSAIPATLFYGIYGFAYATLAANALRLVLIIITGLRYMKPNE